MERLRRALTALHNGTEEAIARRKEADARSKDLEAALDARDEEIALLNDSLSLRGRLLQLTDELDRTQRRMRDNNERIRWADLNADRLQDKLQRAELQRDTFEDHCRALEAKHRELQAQLDDLL